MASVVCRIQMWAQKSQNLENEPELVEEVMRYAPSQSSVVEARVGEMGQKLRIQEPHSMKNTQGFPKIVQGQSTSLYSDH